MVLANFEHFEGDLVMAHSVCLVVHIEVQCTTYCSLNSFILACKISIIMHVTALTDQLACTVYL